MEKVKERKKEKTKLSWLLIAAGLLLLLLCVGIYVQPVFALSIAAETLVIAFACFGSFLYLLGIIFMIISFWVVVKGTFLFFFFFLGFSFVFLSIFSLFFLIIL